MAHSQTATTADPSIGAILGAIGFWVASIGIAALTVRWNVPGYVWALRIGLIAAGVVVAIVLIVREKQRAARGLPADRDASAFDLWTIAHTLAGMVMGAWGVPGPLVVVYTVAWEIFEWQVPGFGEAEITLNRIVDVAVACIGWALVTLIVAAATRTAVPWLLPSIGSIVRP